MVAVPAAWGWQRMDDTAGQEPRRQLNTKKINKNKTERQDLLYRLNDYLSGSEDDWRISAIQTKEAEHSRTGVQKLQALAETAPEELK